MAILDRAPFVEKTSLFGTSVHVVLRSRDAGDPDIRNILTQSGMGVTSVHPVMPSLEDVFLDVVDRMESRRAA